MTNEKYDKALGFLYGISEQLEMNMITQGEAIKIIDKYKFDNQIDVEINTAIKILIHGEE